MSTRTIALLGATGTLGRLLQPRLEQSGWTVRALSRRTGVDASTGVGLDQGFAGCEAVIDALGITTISRRKATRFFTRTAGQVCEAVTRQGVSKLVCVSIANTDQRAVRRALGYYDAKARQEETYRAGGVPLVVTRTTQWFELALPIAPSRLPVAAVPMMRIQPVAAAEAADFVIRHIDDEAGTLAILAGPKAMALRDVVSGIAAHRGRRMLCVPVPMPAAIRDGTLIPDAPDEQGQVMLAQWLNALPTVRR